MSIKRFANTEQISLQISAILLFFGSEITKYGPIYVKFDIV